MAVATVFVLNLLPLSQWLLTSQDHYRVLQACIRGRRKDWRRRISRPIENLVEKSWGRSAPAQFWTDDVRRQGGAL